MKLSLILLASAVATPSMGGATGGTHSDATSTWTKGETTEGYVPGDREPPPSGVNGGMAGMANEPVDPADSGNQLASMCPYLSSCCKDLSGVGTFNFTAMSSGNDGATDSSCDLVDPNLPAICSAAQMKMMCIPCAAECQDKAIMKGPPAIGSAGSETAMDDICADKTCSPLLFNAMEEMNKAMMQPTCSAAFGGPAPAPASTTGAPDAAASKAQGAEQSAKQTDGFAFFCTKNSASKYCMLEMAPASTDINYVPPVIDSCEHELIKKAKNAGCCFGSIIAQLANNPMPDPELDAILEWTKECKLSLQPCTEGALQEVAVVEDKIDVALTKDEVKKNKGEVKKAIATAINAPGVTANNVVITGIQQGSAQQQGRRLSTGCTVDYGVAVPQKSGSVDQSTLQSDVSSVDASAVSSSLEVSVKGDSDSSSGLDPMLIVGGAAGLVALVGLAVVAIKKGKGSNEGESVSMNKESDSAEVTDSAESRQVV